jgi:cyclic-di-GMP-binding protein
MVRDEVHAEKSHDSVADHVRSFLADLPDDPLDGLEAITARLDAISSTPGFTVDYRFALIDALDGAAKRHQEKIARNYVEAVRSDKSRAGQLWELSNAFWTHLGAGYLHCIEQFQASAAGHEALQPKLPVVSARVLRALTMQIKWSLQRYSPTNSRVWKDAGRVYLFSESHNCTTQRLPIYPGAHGESSVEEEFLKALMLTVSAPGSLPPVGIHIAERIVAHYGRHFVLKPRAALYCNFYFDLSKQRSPSRVHTDMEYGPMVRFFGGGDAEKALDDFARQVDQGGGIPSGVYLGGDFDKEVVLSVLHHLQRHWAGMPAERGVQRRQVATRLTVVHGLTNIWKWIVALTSATPLEAADPSGAESWAVFDTNEGGYGAVLPPANREWLRIGALVGLRAETKASCRVGVIRRIATDSYGQTRVGIALMGQVAIRAMVMRRRENQAVAITPIPAVLLQNKPSGTGELQILVPSGCLELHQKFEMRVDDQIFPLASSDFMERAEEFDLILVTLEKRR